VVQNYATVILCIHDFLSSKSQSPKRHLDRFIRLCWWQTDRQDTQLTQYCVAIGRILCYALRCGLTTHAITDSRLAANETRRSSLAEGPRDALCQLKSCQLLNNCTKNSVKLAMAEWHGHQNCLRSVSLSLVCITASILHSFRDFVSFAVYVTVCNLENSFISGNTVGSTNDRCCSLYFVIYKHRHTAVNTRCFPEYGN